MKRIWSSVRVYVFLGIGLLLLYLVFKDVDLVWMWNEIKKANPSWIALSFACGLVAMISRAWRWRIILEPLGYKPGLLNCFNAVAIGYLANIGVPRMGEVVRCTMLNQTDKVPVTQLIGTVILERVIDLLILLSLIGVVILTQFERFGNFFRNEVFGDKLDKIGEDGVKKEMMEKGFSETAIVKVQPLFSFTGTFSEKINQLSGLLADSSEGMKGVEELRFICDKVSALGLSTAILDLDVTLARGLNYYTGAIFEVAAPKGVAMGSIGGGGRYDDLTGIFGLKNMSGVGISFGLDRIYLVVEELDLFPTTVTATSQALFINYGENEAFYAMKAIKELRQLGIKVELYPENAK